MDTSSMNLALYSGTHNIQCIPFGHGTILLSYIISIKQPTKCDNYQPMCFSKKYTPGWSPRLHFPGRTFTLWSAVLCINL